MYDYHTHSYFSGDCYTSTDDMIEAAILKGIKEMAVTDHYDPDDLDYPFAPDFIKYHKKLSEITHTYEGRIKIIKGIEIGIQHGNTLLKCEHAANAYPYDFILGAFHAARSQNLYSRYFDDRTPEDGFGDFYTYMADCIKMYKNFDVLAHFNVIDRYVSYVPDYAPYMDVIESILIDLIDHGKGIEFNTSSFRYGMKNTTPSEEILQLYKELGGEIITIGSDAHKAQDIGYAYEKGIAIIKSHGFKYLTTFENRKPDFIRI